MLSEVRVALIQKGPVIGKEQKGKNASASDGLFFNLSADCMGGFSL